jgi:hypothetical protein
VTTFLNNSVHRSVYNYGHGLSVRIATRCSMRMVYYGHIHTIKWVTPRAIRETEEIDDYARRWSPFQSR